MPSSFRVLLAAEGSGGHLIPALEVARVLASRAAEVMLLYAERAQTACLLQDLIQDTDLNRIQIHPIALSPCRLPAARVIWRLWQAGSVWRLAQERFSRFRPCVVVGFGGWFCVPVMLAARQRHLPVLLHEQNVRLGRANRFLKKYADRIALSFEASRADFNGSAAVITGLPIRETIGFACRDEAASRFGVDPHAPTVLILGGSQGSRAINHLVCQVLEALPSEARGRWQFIHLTGPADYEAVHKVYATSKLRCWVAPYLAEMELVYAMADVVVARAGASTIAELARCGIPAVLIPYPYAGGHQRANAQLVESVGAGVCLEEAAATPSRLVGLLQRLLSDGRLRRMMGEQMRTVARPDATERLAEAIVHLGHAHAHSTSLRAMVSERSESNHA